jgi:hypothetical protein
MNLLEQEGGKKVTRGDVLNFFRFLICVICGFTPVAAAAHPGGGLIALDINTVIFGDSMYNAVWRLERGKKPQAHELHIGVRLTTGEHSKDSSSQTTTITVDRDTIVWERTFTGRRRATSPSRKEFKLSSADNRNLLTLIRSNNLLVTDSIELPRKSSNFRYFEISVELTLDDKKGAISISGMNTAVEVKAEKLYQNTMTLVKELYRVMNLQDNSMTFVDIIDEPIKR